MMRRVAVLVLALMTLSTATALACNDPSLGSVRPSAGAGDPVTFSAVNLDPGASYALLLAGQTVASGSVEGEVVEGSFAMPDLGRASTYFLELRVAHDGGTWVSSRPIQFVVPAPAPAPAPKAPAAARPKGQTVASSAKPAVKRQAAPKAPVGATAARPAATTTVSGSQPASALTRQEPAARAKPAARPKTQIATPPLVAKAPAPSVHETRPNDAPLDIPVFVAAAQPRAEASSPVALQPAVVRRSGHSAWLLWLAIFGACVLVSGGSALVIALRRRRMQEALIEAELQEMIAEARARQTQASARIRFLA